MEKSQYERLRSCRVDIVDVLEPSEILPHLRCLTKHDKEQILCDEKNNGNMIAASTLVDRLYRRSGSYRQFMDALMDRKYDDLAEKIDSGFVAEYRARDVSNEAIGHARNLGNSIPGQPAVNIQGSTVNMQFGPPPLQPREEREPEVVVIERRADDSGGEVNSLSRKEDDQLVLSLAEDSLNITPDNNDGNIKFSEIESTNIDQQASVRTEEKLSNPVQESVSYGGPLKRNLLSSSNKVLLPKHVEVHVGKSGAKSDEGNDDVLTFESKYESEDETLLKSGGSVNLNPQNTGNTVDYNKGVGLDIEEKRPNVSFEAKHEIEADETLVKSVAVSHHTDIVRSTDHNYKKEIPDVLTKDAKEDDIQDQVEDSITLLKAKLTNSNEVKSDGVVPRIRIPTMAEQTRPIPTVPEISLHEEVTMPPGADRIPNANVISANPSPKKMSENTSARLERNPNAVSGELCDRDPSYGTGIEEESASKQRQEHVTHESDEESLLVSDDSSDASEGSLENKTEKGPVHNHMSEEREVLFCGHDGSTPNTAAQAVVTAPKIVFQTDVPEVDVTSQPQVQSPAAKHSLADEQKNINIRKRRNQEKNYEEGKTGESANDLPNEESDTEKVNLVSGQVTSIQPERDDSINNRQNNGPANRRRDILEKLTIAVICLILGFILNSIFLK